MSAGEKVIAFILLVTDSNSLETIFEEVHKMDKVRETYLIYGDFDLIIKVELNSVEEMASFMRNLRKKFNIKMSRTLISLGK